MSSYLYQLQDSVETIIKEVLPENIELICRRKGDIANDINNALAKIGIAVVVSVPLPSKFSNSFQMRFEDIAMNIAIIENVLTKKSTIDTNAYVLLELLCEKLHQARPLDRAIVHLDSIEDQSPESQPIIIFNLTINIK